MVDKEVRNLLFSLFIPMFFISLGTGIVNPIIPLFAKSFEVTFGLATLVVTAMGIGRVLIDIPSGLMMDRVGRKPIMLIGASLALISGLLSGLAQNFYELIFYRFLTGLAMGMWMGGRQTMVADAVHSSIRGRVMASLMISHSVGLSVGPAIGGFLAELWGIRSPFFFYAGASFVSLVLTQTMIKETRPDIPKLVSQGIGKKMVSMKRILSISFLPLGFATFATHLRWNARSVLIPFLGAYSLKIGLIEIGILLSILSAVILLLTLPAGVLIDKIGRKKALVPSLTITAIALWFFPLAGDFSQAIYISILMGLGSGLGAGVLGTMAADIAPTRDRGLHMSLFRTTGDVGGLLGPLLAGLMIDFYNIEVSFFSVAFITSVAAVTSQIFLKETYSRNTSPK